MQVLEHNNNKKYIRNIPSKIFDKKTLQLVHQKIHGMHNVETKWLKIIVELKMQWNKMQP